jgi:hypothetical protein
MTRWATIDTPFARIDYLHEGQLRRKVVGPYWIQKNSMGPGYEIMGMLSLPDGTMPSVATVCRAVDMLNRRHWHPHHNGKVWYGFRTVLDAQVFAKDKMGEPNLKYVRRRKW